MGLYPSDDYKDSITNTGPPIVASIKHDKGKLPWDLLPVDAIEDIVAVLQYGAEKYAPRNWESPGFAYLRLWAAAIRHLMAWRRGDTFDDESGLHHLAHAVCCILFLLQYHHTGKGKDDRNGEETT
jgi:hypothetical protein